MEHYTVKKGDTLWLIAKRNKISLEALVASNPQIHDPNYILPGMRINIPQMPQQKTSESNVIRAMDTEPVITAVISEASLCEAENSGVVEVAATATPEEEAEEDCVRGSFCCPYCCRRIYYC